MQGPQEFGPFQGNFKAIYGHYGAILAIYGHLRAASSYLGVFKGYFRKSHAFSVGFAVHCDGVGVKSALQYLGVGLRVHYSTLGWG